MFVVYAWFAGNPTSARRARAAARRVDVTLVPLLSSAYERRDIGGPDWGITVCHLDPGPFRWPTFAEDVETTAVSLGIPVGSSAAGGPLAMARRLLRGEDVHADVVPPFGLIACRGATADRVVIQQDWLGHCRLFTTAREGITAFSNRPSLLAAALTARTNPSNDGWASYTVAGHFGGSTSPLDGVRLLHPGERVTCRRSPDGDEPAGWTVAHDRRFCADDVVRRGLDERECGPEVALDRAASALQQVVTGLGQLYADEVTLGLSGGWDSRLIAAAFVSAGQVPTLRTHDDTPAEADTARRLVSIIEGTRGLRPVHEVGPAGAPANVLGVGLRDRAVRLLRQYDFQFPSTYLVRPAASERLPVSLGGLSVTGAAGELATGYWYGAGDDESTDAVRGAVRQHLLSAVPATAVRAHVVASERARLDALVDAAASLGLVGAEQIDYAYLMERMRRWSTSAYQVGMVVPFLAPDVVAATFALTAAEKRGRRLHTGLLQRFVPEWCDVPYVSISTGRSTATAIWDGDGLNAVRWLFYRTAPDGIVGMLRPNAVYRALSECADGRYSAPHRRTLQQFVALAVASRALDPDTARPMLPATLRRVRREGVVPPHLRRPIPRQRPQHGPPEIVVPAQRSDRRLPGLQLRRLARRSMRKIIPRRARAS